MNALIFLLLCLLVVYAAYLVIQARRRSTMTFGELVSHIRPPKEPVLGPWSQVSDLLREHRNSAYSVAAADRYRRVMRVCTDEKSAGEMNLTYRTFLSNHAKRSRALMTSLASCCFDKIASDYCRTCRQKVVRYRTTELLLLEEMSEVIDPLSVAVLEGQFLHGT